MSAAAKRRTSNGARMKQQLVDIFRVQQAHNIRRFRLAYSLLPGEPVRNLTADGAAANGYLFVLEHLHNQGKRCTETGAEYACANGHVEVVRFLHAQRYCFTSTDADLAAGN